MNELIEYMQRNGFRFEISDDGIITIDGKTYELSAPNVMGIYFDRFFHYIGEEISAENYIYKFGGLYYTLKKGDEQDVKLKLFKYIGQVDSDAQTYAFLGIHGPYELLNGSGDYEDWCAKARFFGTEVLGICEKDTLAGALKFQLACEKFGIKSVLGETVSIINTDKDLLYTLKFYAENERGWNNILSLNKIINVEMSKVAEDRLPGYLEGVSVVIDPKVLAYDDVPRFLRRKDHVYYQLDSVKFEQEEKDKEYLLNLQKFISGDIPPCSICDAYYLDEEYYYLKDRLNRIGGISEPASNNQYFKSTEEYLYELKSLFREEDEDKMFDLIGLAIDNTNQIADRCSTFQIEVGHRHLPQYKMTKEESEKYGTKEDMLIDLIAKGLEEMNVPDDELEKYLERIETEVDVIQYGNVVDYFLILWDIVKWCKQNDILVGYGRGSAGGSLVARLLGLHHINPLDYNLLFERFLSKARVQKSLADIDTDIAMDKRPLVKQYIEERYGQDRVCSVGTYTTLQMKAAMKDLARLRGVPPQEVNMITTKMGLADKDPEDLFRLACQRKDISKFINQYPDVIQTAILIHGQPKARSIHACAMMIYPEEKDMFHWNPVRKQDSLMVSEWEGGELDGAGFLKEDILGILQLSKFAKILELIKTHTGEEIDIYNLPTDDTQVFRYFQNGWTGDVFHFGAKGLTGYCKQLKPDNITELINCIGLYRPGVMESNFHNEYILRKQGESEETCRIGAKEIMAPTRSIMIWQEQVMQLFAKLGGFTMVDADEARRAMGKKKVEKLLPFRDRFLEHYQQEYGVNEKYAADTWKEIENSSAYLFNASHATAYALTGYACQWLKVHYPLEYWSVAFSYADDEDYPVYLHEMNEIGSAAIMPPDINESVMSIRTDFDNSRLYWSLASVKQVGEKAQEEIMKEKENGPYFSLDEFIDRHSQKGSKVTKSVIENLIVCGAFDKLEKITLPSSRWKLIEKYREGQKVKVDKEKDIFLTNPGKRDQDWWWSLLQKRLCGLAFFDYRDLYVRYFKQRVYSEFFPFRDFSEIIDNATYKKEEKMTVAGYVYEIEIKSGKKGEYAILTLEQNYQFRKVIVWSEQFDQFSDLLKDCGKSIMFLNGVSHWDERSGEFLIYSTPDTDILILV